MLFRWYVFLCLSTMVFAHPVLWKGGTDYTFKLTPSVIDFNAFYTIHRAKAIGFHLTQNESHESAAYFHYNQRLYRKNKPNSQQNFYGLVGLGYAQTQLAIHSAFQWDWETKRYFRMLKVDWFSNHDTMIALRIGVAPYIGGFDDINTWLMLEFQPNINDNYKGPLIPVLRLFKQNVLVDIGFGDSNFIELMIHL